MYHATPTALRQGGIYMSDKDLNTPDSTENPVNEDLKENEKQKPEKEKQTDPLAAFQKEMKKMQDAAKAEVQKMLQNAQKSADDIVNNAKVAAEQIMQANSEAVVRANASTAENKPQEMVPIKLFKDGGRYKNDMVVALNGVPYAIQRGKTIMVPRGVAEIIESSLRQDIDAALYREQQEEAYAATLK